MVVGLACTHLPATGGVNEGCTDPSATGVENVTLMVAFDATVFAPAAGTVERMVSGVTTRGTVVVVLPSAFFGSEPDEDFPRPYATPAATTISTNAPSAMSHTRRRPGGFP
jgi:hypothetical protein